MFNCFKLIHVSSFLIFFVIENIFDVRKPIVIFQFLLKKGWLLPDLFLVTTSLDNMTRVVLPLRLNATCRLIKPCQLSSA